MTDIEQLLAFLDKAGVGYRRVPASSFDEQPHETIEICEGDRRVRGNDRNFLHVRFAEDGALMDLGIWSSY